MERAFLLEPAAFDVGCFTFAERRLALEGVASLCPRGVCESHVVRDLPRFLLLR